jgi:uncharacterized protein YqhQ
MYNRRSGGQEREFMKRKFMVFNVYVNIKLKIILNSSGKLFKYLLLPFFFFIFFLPLFAQCMRKRATEGIFSLLIFLFFFEQIQFSLID